MKPESHKPTDSELEILQILWEGGPATVRAVNDAISARAGREPGYTTTLKLMQIMHEKGLLTRVADGKTHIYSAAISREATQGQLVDQLLDKAFGGSAMQLVMQALGNRKSSSSELSEIRAFLDSLDSTDATRP